MRSKAGGASGTAIAALRFIMAGAASLPGRSTVSSDAHVAEDRLLLISLRAPAHDRVRDGRIYAAARGGLSAALGAVSHRVGAYLSVDDIPFASTHKATFDGIANRVLWPILHGMPTKACLHGNDFEGWEKATDAFARAADIENRSALVWVHDYQLSLLPGRLRSMSPHARIGWFCHVPWPGCDMIALLPNRKRILDGILGASYIGFHTPHYRDNFLSCVEKLTPYAVDKKARSIRVNGRIVRVGVHAVGVPFETFDRCGRDPEVRREAERIRAELGAEKLVLAVDRLDYTKGILERLHALEMVLQDRPSLRKKLCFVQVAAPTRPSVPGYAELRREVEAVVGAINGRFAEGGWVPIRYWARSISGSELVALYLAADVMAVTPLRDGMNLVAQEFVASRHDERGVLVLSELAGAAHYLRHAVMVNPWWIEDTIRGFVTALEMPEEEQRERMRKLREETRRIDIADWIPGFVEELEK